MGSNPRQLSKIGFSLRSVRERDGGAGRVCVARRQIEISAAAAATIPSSVTVAMPFNRAWDRFVRKLGQNFFVVNNISKESRFISISVGHNQAERFIDCGTLTQKVNSKDWTFNPADNADFNESGFRTGTVVEHRVSGRAGRMNIVVAPKGPNTVFEVNTSYTLRMVESGRNEVRNLIGHVVSSENLQVMRAGFQFTTKTADEQPFGAVNITCQATGVWEQLVLDLAR